MKSLLPTALQKDWNVRDTASRRDRMAELAFAGYRIPRCGKFADMVRLGVPLVVYKDEFAHCGEGKFLWVPRADGVELDGSARQYFCSEYMPDDATFEDDYEHEGSTEKSSRWVSRRLLVVGHHSFSLVYTSRSSWMTNVDGEYEITDGSPSIRRCEDLLPYPMYAIDYTEEYDEDFGNTHTHFDLNTCPGVPLEVVNMVGRDVLTDSVADFCRERGLI